MKLILLRGYPGAGKTTLGKRLEESGFGKLIDTNYMLSCVDELVDDAYRSLEIYDQLIILEKTIMTQLLSDGKNVIVARGFSGVDAVRDYSELAETAGAETYVVRLDTPKAELAERVTAPDRKQNYSFLTTPEQFEEWMDQHTVDPCEGELVIDTTKAIDDCLKDVVEFVGTTKS
jgi:predicted kinase